MSSQPSVRPSGQPSADLIDMTIPAVEPMGPELQAYVEQLAAKYGPEHIDDDTLWYTDPARPAWLLAMRWFPGLTREAIRRDPITADQAMREFKACRACKSWERCRLEWQGADTSVPHDALLPSGSKHFYLAYARLPYVEGEVGRWEWRKRRCESQAQRAAQIAEVSGAMRDIGGGIRAVEVQG